MSKYQKYKEYNQAWKKKWYAENKESDEFKDKRNEYQRRYRSMKSEEVKTKEKKRNAESRGKHRVENPHLYMYYDAKRRAKKKGIEFTITSSDITIPKICPVLGLEIVIGNGRTDGSPSLDRFNNNLGYTKDNIRVISFRANTLKNNATVDELKAIINYMEGN